MKHFHKKNGPLAGGPEYLQAFEKVYGTKSNRSAGADVEPADYYMAELGKLRVRGEWADAVCPFHDDKAPSLSVSLRHGGFKCHACGASGDLIAFHMRRYGVTFKAACAALGVRHG